MIYCSNVMTGEAICEGMRKLREAKVRIKGYVCWCSPIERYYEIKVNDKWVSINKCPYCGSPISIQLGDIKIQKEL